MTSPLMQLKFLNVEPYRRAKVGTPRERFQIVEPSIQEVAKEDNLAIVKLASEDLTTFFCFNDGGSLRVHWALGDFEVLYDDFVEFCHIQVGYLKKQLSALSGAPDLTSFQIKTKDRKLHQHDCLNSLFGLLDGTRSLKFPTVATRQGKYFLRIK